MVLELISKEIKEGRSSSNKSIFSTILKYLFFAAMIALEIYIFISLNRKIDKYSSFGIFDFLVFFLFIMCLVDVIFATIRARKTFFKKLDSKITLPLPIESSKIIVSKSLYLYLSSVVTNLFISSPLLITYGVLNHMIPYYFVFCLIYPVLISLFDLGLALLFVVPYEYVYKLIKGKELLQFVLASILVIGLCFIYKYVLDLFLSVLDSSSTGGALSPALVNGLHKGCRFFMPAANLLLPVIKHTNVIQNILIFFGATLLSLVVGFMASSVTYTHMSKNETLTMSQAKKRKRQMIEKNTFKTLLKKEFVLLFRDSGYMFSYTALLIMQPFLTVVVISSLNSIMYSGLRIFLVYFPELINGINIALVLLFSNVINSSASLGISREEKAVQILKYIPVDPFKQTLAKLTIPTILSSASLIVTTIILISTGSVTPIAFWMSLILGLVLIVSLNVLSLYLDMQDRSAKSSKLSILSPILAMALPLLILGYIMLIGLTTLKSVVIYIILIALLIAIFLPMFIMFKKLLLRGFNMMEVR